MTDKVKGETTKAFGMTDKVKGETTKAFGMTDKVKGETTKAFGTPAKVKGEAAKAFGRMNKAFGEVDKGLEITSNGFRFSGPIRSGALKTLRCKAKDYVFSEIGLKLASRSANQMNNSTIITASQPLFCPATTAAVVTPVVTQPHFSPARPNGTRHRVRVGVVGEANLELECLAALIAGQPDLKLCVVEEEIGAALGTESNQSPDVLVVLGLSRLPKQKAFLSGTTPPLIVIVRRAGADVSGEAFNRGAQGCITDRDNKETLVKAIEAVRRGETYMSEAIGRLVIQSTAFPRLTKRRRGALLDLSTREAQVFERLGRAQSTPQIATELKLSLPTVQAYCARIRQKRGLKNFNELRAAAARQAI